MHRRSKPRLSCHTSSQPKRLQCHRHGLPQRVLPYSGFSETARNMEVEHPRSQTRLDCLQFRTPPQRMYTTITRCSGKGELQEEGAAMRPNKRYVRAEFHKVCALSMKAQTSRQESPLVHSRSCGLSVGRVFVVILSAYTQTKKTAQS